MIWDHLMVMPITHQERENWSEKVLEFYNKVCLIISYKRFLRPLSSLACGWVGSRFPSDGTKFVHFTDKIIKSLSLSPKKINRNYYGVPKVGPLLLHSYGFCSNLFTCRSCNWVKFSLSTDWTMYLHPKILNSFVVRKIRNANLPF